MAIRFYLVPIERNGNSRGPKYFKWRGLLGLSARWSLKDFGNDIEIGLIASQAELARPDVLPLSNWSSKQRDGVAGYLRNAGVESSWVTGAGDWREGLHRLAGLTQAYQSGQDEPDIWLSKQFHFGLVTLDALDKVAFIKEQEALKSQTIERLRVQWSPRQPSWLDWLRGLNPLLLPFMALPATDAFTGTDNTVLTTYSSNWSFNAGTFRIQSNAVRPDTGATDGAAFWNADSFNANQYAQGTIVARSGGAYLGVAARCAAAGVDTFYGYEADSADLAYLFKHVAGVSTTISTAAVFAVNDVVRLEASGTSLTCKRNGSADTIGTQTDSSIASGSAGISGAGGSTGARLDTWEGGDLAAAAGQPAMVRWGGIPGMNLTGRRGW